MMPFLLLKKTILKVPLSTPVGEGFRVRAVGQGVCSVPRSFLLGQAGRQTLHKKASHFSQSGRLKRNPKHQLCMLTSFHHSYFILTQYQFFFLGFA